MWADFLFFFKILKRKKKAGKAEDRAKEKGRDPSRTPALLAYRYGFS